MNRTVPASDRGGARMWIRVEVGFSKHTKTRELASLLGIDRRLAAGAMLDLWDAVRLRAPDGNLARWKPIDFAFEMGFPDERGTEVLEALVAVGFVDETTVGREVHEWQEHNGDHLRDAARKRNSRKAKPEPSRTSGGSPRTSGGHPVLRDGTVRDETDLAVLTHGAPARDDSQESFTPEQAAENRQKLAELIGGIGAGKRMPKPAHNGAQPPHVAAVWDLVVGLDPDVSRQALKLSGRLMRLGIKHPRVLHRVIGHYLAHRSVIENPFAYYAPGGKGMDILESAAHAEHAIAEDQAIRTADARWLNPEHEEAAS